MESTSRAAASEETEPCHERQSKRTRRVPPQDESGEQEDGDRSLKYKNFLIRKGAEYKPGQPTALHLWIRDATHTIKERVAKARLLTAGDLKDVVAKPPWMTDTVSEDEETPHFLISWTPVPYALSLDAEEWVLERLLSVCVGADLFVNSGGGNPLLWAAAKNRSYEVFKLLLHAAGKYAPKLARTCSTKISGSPFHELCSKKRVDDRTLHLLIDTMVVDSDMQEQHPLSVTDLLGDTPLHVAARVGARVSVLKKLVTLCPGALQMKTCYPHTRIPLLIAADSYPDTQNSESIRLLMNAWPQGVQFKDNEGRTLIHRPLPDDILDEALKLWPDGIKCPDLLTRNGVLQMNPQHVRFILSRLSSDSLAAFVATMPLHKRHYILDAGRDEKRDLETVVAVVEACPDVLKMRDKSGETPFHIRGFNFSKPDSIALFLLRQYPCALYLPVETIEFKTGEFLDSSMVGIFFSQVGSPVPLKEDLVALLRHTIVKGDDIPPLHIVASHSAGDHADYAKTVKFLNELDANSIRQKVSDAVPHGGQDRLPLHVACAQPDCSADNLQVLLDLHKCALDVEDAKGFYPFMIAASNESASVECVYRLLRHWPRTFEAKSNADL